MSLTRRERLREMYARLAAAPEASSHDEAYDQLANTINQVEDELTSVAYDPEHWETDGRIYPPFADNRRRVEGHPLVTRYRGRRHDTIIGANGSIEIPFVAARWSPPRWGWTAVWELDERVTG